MCSSDLDVAARRARLSGYSADGGLEDVVVAINTIASISIRISQEYEGDICYGGVQYY